MNVIESVRLAVRGLSANKMRSILTMLGIIIGVGAVIALLSIGQGAQTAITQQVQGIGSNLIFVVPGVFQEGGVSFGMGSLTSLTLDDAEAVADTTNCPSIAAVSPEFSRNAQIVYRNHNSNASVVGAVPDYAVVRKVEIGEGRFFDSQDVSATARVAVLGSRLAADLFDSEAPLGKTIRINRIPFQVVGVLAERGGGGSIDNSALIPLSTAQTRVFGVTASRFGGRVVSLITASAVDEAHMDSAMTQITDLLRVRHRIQYQDDDFTVTSQKDILGVLNQITSILTVFLGAIAGISLLVGGIGIMNIMLVSVTERTREIGIRKAVGAKRRDILLQFLIEAMVLSIIGGALGIGFGALVAGIVTATGVLVTKVSVQAVLLAVSFSLGVGLFFGIYPATRAASLHPIDALRYE